MIRSRPLETVDVSLAYLDVVALADRYGVRASADVLAAIDDFYGDQHHADGQGAGRGIAAQLARQLADPRPADASVTEQLGAYRNLLPQWADWADVRRACLDIAAAMLDPEG